MFRRPRFRLPSLSAFTGGLIVFATLAYLNLDGYHNEPFGPGGFNDEPPDINWTHGWPYVCMGRSSVDVNSVLRHPQLEITSRWPFDGVPATYFYVNSLLADIAIAVAFVAATVCSLDYLVRRWPVRLRYGLKFLFILMTVSAIAIVFGWPDLSNRVVQYRVAMTILLAAATTVPVALISLVLRKPHPTCDVILP